MTQLILGGARSGKSRLAEARAQTLVERSGADLFYVATARAGDGEMSRRIAQHRARRQGQWQLIEEPLNLAAVIERHRETNACVLVDCLTLWISNCLHTHCWEQQRDLLLKQVSDLEQTPLTLLLVSNEVGSGIVPLGELSREFVDASGWLHQALAQHCERVTLVVAGLPLELKTNGTT